MSKRFFLCDNNFYIHNNNHAYDAIRNLIFCKRYVKTMICRHSIRSIAGRALFFVMILSETIHISFASSSSATGIPGDQYKGYDDLPEQTRKVMTRIVRLADKRKEKGYVLFARALPQMAININSSHRELSHRFWIMRILLKEKPIDIPNIAKPFVSTSDPFSVIFDLIEHLNTLENHAQLYAIRDGLKSLTTEIIMADSRLGDDFKALLSEFSYEN